jgi:hypothetical protein
VKRLRFTKEKIIIISKIVTTNRNGFGVELNSKNFKARTGEIEVVVDV